MSFLSTHKDGRVLLNVHVQPRASRNGLEGIYDNSIKLAITASPVDGKANAAVVTFLASFLGLKKKDIEIRHGLHSRNKGVLIAVLDGEEVRRRIFSVLSP
ncbi:MAG: DUF167 domain-containing protein [Proteobacteria bacterium]|nr:DUF167 domain-containing protein [Pseudomonadota bacterium]MBU1059723.1 DUF167 domain-containing protein [Pseudomonadota bacterium]